MDLERDYNQKKSLYLHTTGSYWWVIGLFDRLLLDICTSPSYLLYVFCDLII